MSSIHFGEYNLKSKDTISAVGHFQKAVKDARETKNNDHLLEAYKLLGGLQLTFSSNYLQKYIDLSNNLSNEDRKIRDKIARIRYETDKYIKETEVLTQQRVYIVLVAVLISVGAILLYLYKVQRAQNRELEFERAQQEANEKIYDLLLKQQSKLEEGRQEERYRISRELHDGILGKLFGARMSVGFMDLHNETLENYLNELQKIETEIRDISHDLIETVTDSHERFYHAVQNYIKGVNLSGYLEIVVEKSETLEMEKYSNSEQIHAFRLIQEAVQNVLKHSRATKLVITFTNKVDYNWITLRDNGIGFNLSKKKEGIGIRNMKNRISILKGKLSITSNVEGTTVIFKIPKM